MEEFYLGLLSAIVFAPAFGALLILLGAWRLGDEFVKWMSLAFTIGVFIATLVLAGFHSSGVDIGFDKSVADMQYTFSVPWIESFNINYFMGMDGISFPLLLLTSFVSMLAMGASWNINKYVPAYCILFLLLETGMLGVFLALDFFLFYVFWEVMLLPMYFLIGIWGGPRREYAAIKFFLYTLLGSVLMLVAILMLYFNSDLQQLYARSDLRLPNETALVNWRSLHLGSEVDSDFGLTTVNAGPGAKIDLLRTRDIATTIGDVEVAFVTSPTATQPAAVITKDKIYRIAVVVNGKDHKASTVVEAINAKIDADPALKGSIKAALAPGVNGAGTVLELSQAKTERQLTVVSRPIVAGPRHTFNLLALTKMGQLSYTDADIFSPALQWWCFLLLFIGFAIKVPSVPVHTWLPDAHVEAPTPISMILAGVLLKMGGYGIIRICYPICPAGGYELAPFVCTLGVVSMVYGAFAALAQRDFKRMVAYSSVSHMGYVVLGLGVWSAVRGTNYETDYWMMGVSGAMFQMIAHGVSSAGMFFCVGVVYDRVHHRNLDEFGGIFGKMPIYTALAIGIFFAALGLPGLCGFIGEVFVVLSVWNYSNVLAVISAAVVILTAGYILWALQRVYLGSEYHGPHEEALTEMDGRELMILSPLFVLAIIFGVAPGLIFGYMDRTIDAQVKDLANWTRTYEQIKATKEATEMSEKPTPAPKAKRAAFHAPAIEATTPVVLTSDAPGETTPGERSAP